MAYTTFLFSLVIMFIPGVIANSLALYCIVPDLKKNKSLVKQLMLTLSVVDITGVTGVTIYHLFNSMDKIYPAVCPLTCFLAVYFTILSGAIATFMASERCMALRAPYWYQEYMFSWKIWTPFVCLVFVITVVCLLPQMGLGDTVLVRDRGNLTFLLCGSFPDRMMYSTKAVFSVTYGVAGILLVVTNLACNTAVILALHGMKKRILPSQRSTGSGYQEFEMTKMLLVLSATFLICWVPMNVQLVMRQCGVKSIPVLNMISESLVGFNFVLDPLIYLILMKKYRQKIKRLLCCSDKPDFEASESAVYTLNNSTLQSGTS